MADTPINPSSVVTNGAEVTASNPLPISLVASPGAGTSLTLNPRTFVVDGVIVSVTNPMPLTIV